MRLVIRFIDSSELITDDMSHGEVENLLYGFERMNMEIVPCNNEPIHIIPNNILWIKETT
jgi:hypothetical protein